MKKKKTLTTLFKLVRSILSVLSLFSPLPSIQPLQEHYNSSFGQPKKKKEKKLKVTGELTVIFLTDAQLAHILRSYAHGVNSSFYNDRILETLTEESKWSHYLRQVFVEQWERLFFFLSENDTMPNKGLLYFLYAAFSFHHDLRRGSFYPKHHHAQQGFSVLHLCCCFFFLFFFSPIIREEDFLFKI